MPRPKGSKNKTVKGAKFRNDYEAQIAGKESEKDALLSEVASLESNLTALKAELKEKKAGIRTLEKEITRLEAQKAAYDAAKEEEEKKAELERVLKQLMADGMSTEEILQKLKER